MSWCPTTSSTTRRDSGSLWEASRGRGRSYLTTRWINLPAAKAIFDLALWSDVTVIDNHIIGGSACLEHGCAGIGDAPPAQRVIVTGNTIVTAKSVPGSLCIGLGGSDLTISRNTCQNAGGAGIGIAVSDQTQSHHIEISRNVVKNSSQAQAGIHAGIELFILCGPGPKCTGGSGTISDAPLRAIPCTTIKIPRRKAPVWVLRCSVKPRGSQEFLF